jgi:hypothetical protein
MGSFDDAVDLSILKKSMKLDVLHQLITIITGIEPPSLSLHQGRHTQLQVPLFSVELLLPLPQHPVKFEDLVTMVGVGLYLVKVLLLSSLGLGPLHVKGGADLGEGFLGDPRFLFPHGKGLLPLRKLLLSREEHLWHLLNYHCRRRRHGRLRRRRRWRGEGPAQTEHGQVSNASVNMLTYCKGQPDVYLRATFTQ